MHKKPLTYSLDVQRICSLLMTILLVWLTISTPVVYQAQHDTAIEQGLAEEDAAGPFSNTNEEKAGGSGVSTLSEYLHESDHYQQAFVLISPVYKFHPDDIYAAFHPELISPPPELQS